ncbi:MAG: hypothetical protein WCJ92_02555 [Alphaproteobacteria bacterium]
MTKNLLVAFLSIFMLKATITAAHNTDLKAADEQMTGLRRYSISTVTAPYQAAIEKECQRRNVHVSQQTFTQIIDYSFLKELLGHGNVPDAIAYGDYDGKNKYYSSIGRVCPDTPIKAPRT